MAKPIVTGIHLVPRPQVQPSTPQPLDAKDNASQALAIANECTELLCNLQDYQETMVQQMAAELSQLQIVALRAIAQRGRRS